MHQDIEIEGAGLSNDARILADAASVLATGDLLEVVVSVSKP